MSAINLARSMQLSREAQAVLPAGVISNNRVWRAVCSTYMPCSIFIARARRDANLDKTLEALHESLADIRAGMLHIPDPRGTAGGGNLR